MSNEISTAFSREYTTKVQLKLQQRGSKLRAAVMEGSHTGKAAVPVEQIGKVVARRRTARHDDTPLIETPHSKRWVTPSDYDWSDLIDNPDKVRTICDFAGSYVTNGSEAIRRAWDEEIVAAFFATSLVGDDAGSTESFDTTNYRVAVDLGGAAEGLTVAKLKQARRKLMAAHVDLENDPIFCAISAIQDEELLNETQVISSDYGWSEKPILVDGQIKRFLGINFIHSELLGVDSSSYRLVPVWAKSGMHFGVFADLTAKVDVRPDKNYSTQVYTSTTCGATRLEQGKVVQILCSEA